MCNNYSETRHGMNHGNSDGANNGNAVSCRIHDIPWSADDREAAENHLLSVFGIEQFYPEQWETIRRILLGERVLLIARTGFGKSLCYQFPATVFSGLTVIFSPLIALMRDQVRYLVSRGIAAACINSGQEKDENEAVLEAARRGELQILYIAPERQNNLRWQETLENLKLAMIVIDEAHCISQWGHDFRPAYQRIVELVQMLPGHLPVLATTATATERTAADIKKQMEGRMQIIRGSLLRPNLKMRVVTIPAARKDEEQTGAKMEWLAEYLRDRRKGQEQQGMASGCGIVYTGTVQETHLYSDWLVSQGINAVAYNGRLEDSLRREIEDELLHNRRDCVVATNALGMGIDKADLRFIIHIRFPQSLTHYYQEIGRAGRDGLPADIILLFCEDDINLPLNFIRNAKPDAARYRQVIEVLRGRSLRPIDIRKECNLRNNECNSIRDDLLRQSIISEDRDARGGNPHYSLRYNAPELDTRPFEELRAAKLQELEDLLSFARDRQPCRMAGISHYLGDKAAVRCEKCDNDRGLHEVAAIPVEDAPAIQYQQNSFPLLEPKGKGKRAGMDFGCAAGWYRHSDVGEAIHRCKYETGEYFPEHLLKRARHALEKHYSGRRFDLIVYVPPSKSGDLVANLAGRLAKMLAVPVCTELQKTRKTELQKSFSISELKQENVRHAFSFPENTAQGKHILLIDDIYDSGQTLSEIGALLLGQGALSVVPLVLAKTMAGDKL